MRDTRPQRPRELAVKAAVLEAPRRISMIEVPDPVPGPGDVVIQVEAAGICGSDLASFMTGAYVEPGQVLGHELAGTVVSIGPETQGIRENSRVAVLPLGRCHTCDACIDGHPNLCRRNVADAIGYGAPGGFAEQVLVRNAALGSNVFELSTTDASSGATIEPLAVALRAVRRLEPRPGETIVVLGLGMIGQCAVRLLDRLGVDVVGVDLSSLRREKASAGVTKGQFGADLLTALGTDPSGRGRHPHAVLDACGALALINDGIRVLRPGGRLGLVSLPTSPLEIDLKRLALLELDIRGNYAYDTEFGEAHEWLEGGGLPLDGLVTGTFALEQCEEAFHAASQTGAHVKVHFLPQNS
jgi:2-desacetyl-2-hydroxyethyl bacteriochlorophyllide A dehydrogenase